MRKYKLLLIPLLVALPFLLYQVYNFILTDETAFHGADTFFLGEVKFESSSFSYILGRRLARTPKGSIIYSVIGDSERNAVVLLNGEFWLYVREDYQVPTKGKITTVISAREDITSDILCEALEDIIESDGETFIREVDSFWRETTQFDVYFENSPLGVRKYIGYVENKLVFVSDFVYNPHAEDDAKRLIVTYKVIEDKYVPIIEGWIFPVSA